MSREPCESFACTPSTGDDGRWLCAFDFSCIEDMDPSLSDGHVIIFDKEIPFELRMSTTQQAHPQEVGSLEAMRAKILVMGDDTNPQHIRVELTCENDLFFHYSHNVDDISFQSMQESQKLMIDFGDYANVLVKMFNSCIKEPHSFLCVFSVFPSGVGRLDFIQNLEYKFLELLSCEFLQSPELVLKNSVTYRYNAIKSKYALAQARLQDIGALVRVKSPALLLQLQKQAQAQLQQQTRSVGSRIQRK